MLDLAVAVGESRGLLGNGPFIGLLASWILVLVSDNEENVQADHVGGSLSLSTSPHRRSLEALGLLHNSGAFLMLLLLVTKNVTKKVQVQDLNQVEPRSTSLASSLLKIFVRPRLGSIFSIEKKTFCNKFCLLQEVLLLLSRLCQ